MLNLSEKREHRAPFLIVSVNLRRLLDYSTFATETENRAQYNNDP